MYVTLSNDLRSKRFYGCFLVMLVDQGLIMIYYTCFSLKSTPTGLEGSFISAQHHINMLS